MAWLEFRYRKIRGKKTDIKLYYACRRLNGKVISRKCGTIESVANNILKEVQREEDSGQIESPSLGAAYKEYEIQVKRTLNPGTWITYKCGVDKLMEFFGEGRKINSISKPEIIRFRARVLQGHKKNGMINVMKQIRTFFSKQIEAGYIQINPASGSLKGFKETLVFKHLNDEEIRHIFDVCATSRRASIRTQLPIIVKTVLLTGLREAESAAFKWRWINGRVITVVGKGRDGGKMRPVPLFSKLDPILEEAKQAFPASSHVFTGWSAGRIRQAWKRIIKRAKKTMPDMGRVRFHDLRHTFASNLQDEGVPINDIQAILGHENITTTARYLHRDIKRLTESMEKTKAGFLEPVKPKFQVA